MPIFIVDNNRGLNNPVHLSEEDAHHLVRVMRAQAGEIVFVTDNNGMRGEMVIESVKPLCLNLKAKTQTPCPRPISVSLPLIDPERLEWAVEKLTEINCAKIILTVTERTQKKTLAAAKLVRLKKIAVAAQKQCGRCWPAEIVGPMTLLDVVKAQTGNAKFFVADLGNGDAFVEDGRPQGAAPTQIVPAIIFVGPEGGFTESERKLFAAHNARFHTLGETVLRTETAALAAYLAILK